MSFPRSPTTRRTAIALTFAAPLALAACDLERSSPTPTAPTSNPAGPDAEAVASACQAISSTMAVLDAATARHRRLRPEATPLLALHTAHLAVLDSPRIPVEAAPAAKTPRLARGQVSDSERELAGALREAARRAASGDLARALASMSAAVTQRVTR